MNKLSDPKQPTLRTIAMSAFIGLFVVCGCDDSMHRYRHYPTLPGVEGGQAEWTYKRAVSRIDDENYRNGHAIPMRCSKCGNPVNQPLDLCDLCK